MPGKYKLCKLDNEKGIDLDNGIIPFILTERMVDRDGEVVEPSGAVIDDYVKNPVFLWAHDLRSPSIGRVIPETIKISRKRLQADVQFDMDDPFAAMIFNKYAKGFLNAGSIRFIPFTIGDKPVLEGQRGPTYKEWELLEFSAVPVPANQGALAQKDFADDLSQQERGQRWLKELSNFMDNDNFDHTPEGWVDLQNKIEEDKSVIPYKKYPLADKGRGWDASGAKGRIARWASSDGSGNKETINWTQYGRAFTWVNRENRENFGSYKLPHHDVINGDLKTVWRGVTAAMAALLGARGGVDVPDGDRRGIYNHLSRHYRDFEEQPPEFKDYSEEELKLEFEEDELPDNSPITVKVDTEKEIIEIEGMKYDFKLFKAWAKGRLKLNTLFCLKSRENETITIEAFNDISLEDIKNFNKVLKKENRELVQGVINGLQNLLIATIEEENKLAPIEEEWQDWDFGLKDAAVVLEKKPETEGEQIAFFPHHNEKGQVVWKGVVQAMLDLFENKDNLPDSALKSAYEHLIGHYKEFQKKPPELEFIDDSSDELDEAVIERISPRLIEEISNQLLNQENQ